MLPGMRIHLPGLVLAAALAAGCGGGSGNAANTATVTAPTAPVTMAEFAPSLGEAMAATVNAALQAAASASAPADGIHGLLQKGLRLFVPVLHAQSGFAANCSRGGNVSIRYAGQISRTVVLAGVPVVYSNCGVAFRGRDMLFSGTLMSNGYWTATDPGPVRLNGDLNVNEIGTAAINGAVTGQQFGGTINGVTVGTPDTDPPPNPNSCPGTLSRSTFTDVPVAGNNYPITFTVGDRCAWSVTEGPAWARLTQTAGRGGRVLLFLIVDANAGPARFGAIRINGQTIAVSQLGATSTTPPPTTPPPTPPPTTPPPTPAPTTGTQGDIVGRWQGTLTVNQPCSQGNPNQTYNWRATFRRSGSEYSMELFDDFFEETRTLAMPALGADRAFEFVIRDPDIGLMITLDGTFASDWQSLSGPISGSIVCNPSNPPQGLKGSWQGRRTGP